jgi:5-methyltetrahydropteroyltriglutamate--homocysteine methyltransferase
MLSADSGPFPLAGFRLTSWADRHDRDAVRAAVRETVARQREAGVDIINDGEVSKPSYATYVTERLSGFGGEPVPLAPGGFEEFPEFAQKMWGDPEMAAIMANPSCDGPVAYTGRPLAEAGIANLQAAAPTGAAEVFMSAASPGVIEMFMANRYYPSTEEYLFALAEAMKPEYDAVSQAGLILQLDCPDLACEWALGPEQSTAEFRKVVAQRLEALDYATRDIPPGRLRMHLCWGNYEGPHHTDIPLADIIDLVLAARPAAVSFEAANPRHEHEWTVFEQVKLPEGKALIPGVLDSTTNYIEHPELVAQPSSATPAWPAGKTSSPAATAASPPSPPSSRSTRRSPGRNWPRWPKAPGWPASSSGSSRPHNPASRRLAPPPPPQ